MAPNKVAEIAFGTMEPITIKLTAPEKIATCFSILYLNLVSADIMLDCVFSSAMFFRQSICVQIATIPWSSASVINEIVVSCSGLPVHQNSRTTIVFSKL